MNTTHLLKQSNNGHSRPLTLMRIAVTIFALIVIRLLFHIPIPGTLDLIVQMSNDGVEFGRTASSLPPSLSIAAIVFVPWLTAVILGQVFVMLVPDGWSRLVSVNGLINPFSWIVIVAGFAISYSQASGVAFSLETTMLPPAGDQFQHIAIASLMAGLAITLVCAWVIERFGIGRGFWVTFAALSLINLSAEISKGFEMMSSGIVSPTAIIGAGCVFIALVALIIFVMLHVMRLGGSFQIVVWPLLIASLLSTPLMSLKEMPEILVPVLAVTLMIAAFATFLLAWRGNQPKLFLPIFVTLALAELTAYFPLASFPFMLTFPLPTAELVMTAGVLTVLAQEFWRRALPTR
jgi:hypothetical protein